ncbi:MAG: L-dopachrome tautomerase-related protein, partial [Planctomycetota bacterium]
TGIAVSQNERVFVCYPRWGERVDMSVAEIVPDGRGELRPIPDAEWQVYDPSTPQAVDPTDHLVSVQALTVDSDNNLWILDTGSINFTAPVEDGPKLIRYDLFQERVVRVIPLGPDVVLPTTYLNDLRVDLRQGQAGFVYISDSGTEGPNGFVVVDIYGDGRKAKTWRKLTGDESVQAEEGFVPTVEGEPLTLHGSSRREGRQPPTIGVNGIALSPDGEWLYYCALTGETLYRVPTSFLRTPPTAAEQAATTNEAAPAPDVAEAFANPVEIVGEYEAKRFASDGLIADRQGRIYLTDLEDNSIRRYDPSRDVPGDPLPMEVVVFDEHLLWPDSMALSNGRLYITSNQLHRTERFKGKDRRDPPYAIFRTQVSSQNMGIRRRSGA